MFEERKQKEIEYYDSHAQKWLESSDKKQEGDFEGFNPFLLKSYQFLKDYLKDKCQGKKILDYGCGNGVHSSWLAKYGGKITAIDLSAKSLEIAREKIKKESVADSVEFLVMDCENLQFPKESFDIVFDGGTFSSLDMNKAIPEIVKVLKKDGFLVGIETLGHNPLTNLKRAINKLTGKRTDWATNHIFKIEDFEKIKSRFQEAEIYFFHLISWAIFPFLSLPGAKYVLRLLEKIDSFLIFIFPFLRKYSFKVVFVFKNPKYVQ